MITVEKTRASSEVAHQFDDMKAAIETSIAKQQGLKVFDEACMGCCCVCIIHAFRCCYRCLCSVQTMCRRYRLCSIRVFVALSLLFSSWCSPFLMAPVAVVNALVFWSGFIATPCSLCGYGMLARFVLSPVVAFFWRPGMTVIVGHVWFVLWPRCRAAWMCPNDVLLSNVAVCSEVERRLAPHS